MAFTAADVKALREKTGVGMMDCKKALAEADGDMDKAIDVLRERGLAASAKKATRIAAEGVVTVYTEGDTTVALEVNAESDFVAKNDVFNAFVLDVAKTIAANKPADVDALLADKLIGTDRTVQENLQDKILQIGENIKIRRFEIVNGITASYIHGGGSVAVVVKFDTTAEIAAKAEFATMGKDVAMQVAAMSPSYLDEAAVPADVIEHEKGILMAQMNEDPKMANKPEQVKAKIIDGKISKYYDENCLVCQDFVKDGDLTVGKYIDKVAKELGGEIKATGFIRYAKGEGLEKKNENFADEVAGMMNK